ncbi:MAG: hypothetical protein ABW174_07590 [Flavitalea sp.]
MINMSKAKITWAMSALVRITLLLWMVNGIPVLLNGQIRKVDLLKPNAGHLYNREAQTNADGSLELNAKEGDGMMILKGLRFSEGTIRVKLKGENMPGSSFVGIAFNIDDEKHFEAIYFRPFNFRNKDRETHSVQYISMPDHPWELLREKFPDKYENKIDPAPDPDSWLDVKIVVKDKMIRVYVNNASKPSLEVTSFRGDKNEKAVAVWVGNNSKGSFKDLAVEKI